MNNVDRRGVSLCLCMIILISIPSLIYVLSPPQKSFLLWINDNFLPPSSADPFARSGDAKKSSPTNDDAPTDHNSPRSPYPFARSSDQERPPADNGDSPPLLLLVSYDGFRYDYIEKHQNVTPTLRWLIHNGVHAPQGLKNTFITITAPNHYGIVTGLYEENHGIIANSFFDPDLNESFAYFDTRWKTDPKFFRGDPIWNSNDAAGPGRVTGCMMWVGCDVAINNKPPPRHRISWDQNLDWTARVDALMGWFTDPLKPVNFGLLYIEEPDETGHNYGPDSPEIRETLRKLDQLTAYLLWQLYTAKLLDKINILFTADHGMSAVPVLNVVNMDEYLNRSLYTVYGGSPNWNVDPAPGKEEEVYHALHNKVPHLTVYNKTSIPTDFHYSNDSAIMPLQLIPHLHWWIAYNYTSTIEENATFPLLVEQEIHGKPVKIRVTSKNYTTGEHGYNNSEPEMHPFFIGFGPALKTSFNVTQFMNLDLYVLMCYILHLKPSPNNGSFERVRSILQDEGSRWSHKKSKYDKTSFYGFNRFGDVEQNGVWKPDDDRVFFAEISHSVGSFFDGFNLDLMMMLLIVILYVAYLAYAIKSIKPTNRMVEKVIYIPAYNEFKTKPVADFI